MTVLRLLGTAAIAAILALSAPVTPAATPSASPTVKIVVTTESIPFESTSVDDHALAQGTTVVRVAGVNGVRTLTFEVTLTGGREVGRKLRSTVVTVAPVTQVTAVGALVQPACDPNYSGCVPIDTDVDCAGGKGNGPSYVRGPVKVTGVDIYGLDADHDGVGCE